MRLLPSLPLLLAAVAFAADAATGAIQGRVFNPATQEYVRNAEITVAGGNLAVVTAMRARV